MNVTRRAPARARLEAERAGAGERIEHRSAGQQRGEAREQRLTDPVGRRTHRVAGRDDEPSPTGRSGDDAHQPAVTSVTSVTSSGTTSSAASTNASTFASSRHAS
jgi:hypothetical protein